MHMCPVIITKLVDFSQFLMMREVNDLGCDKLDCIFIFDPVDFLGVIHDK